MIIETISLRDLIHHRQMRPVLAPPLLRRIINQSRDQPEGLPSTLGVLAIEHNADDVVHFTHADDKRPDEVQAGFFASPPAKLVLCHTIVAADFGDRTEEEVGAVGEPVDPFQLCGAGDSLEGVVPCLKDFVVGHIFGLKVPGAWNAFEEGIFDYAEEDVADGFGAIDGAVEVPAAEVELLCYRVHLVVCQWFV